MNTKIIRNFSMMVLMLGAMFVLSSNKAQAQSDLQACTDYCGSQVNECFQTTCGEDYGFNCAGSNSSGEQFCYSQFQECMAGCGISVTIP